MTAIERAHFGRGQAAFLLVIEQFGAIVFVGLGSAGPGKL